MNLLPWHQQQATHVQSLLENDRLPHAMLVTAAAGWGETIFANWLALTLLGEPTDRSADQLAHADLRWIKPDGALIKVDAIRDLAEFAVGTAQRAARKVAVLEDAHAMNSNAANALLKTLEEPPSNTHLILATTHPAQLLATIRSRCQTLRILPRPELARQWLESEAPGRAVADLLAEYNSAPMAVFDALHAEERPLRELLAESCRPESSTNEVDALLALDPLNVTGRWYRYCVAMLADARSGTDLGTTPQAVMQFTDELVAARRQLQFSNSTNVRLLMERLLSLWAGLANEDPGPTRS